MVYTLLLAAVIVALGLVALGLVAQRFDTGTKNRKA